MLGVLLSSIATFFDEISLSIGKAKADQKQISVYSFGFLNNLFVFLFFLIIILVKQKFVFSLASLPTFATRAILEIILIQIALTAVIRADRSTYGFIRVITLPLLLVVDLILGYQINNFQMAGIGLIVVVLFLIFMNHGIKKQGAVLTLCSAVLAVATLSLYKYDISHFNSVESEQIIITFVVLIYLMLMAKLSARENPLIFLKKPIFSGQSLAAGMGGLIGSFAYGLAPASVIIASVRSSAILWTVVSGKFYFHEKNIIVKMVYLFLLIAGILLLTL